MPSEKKECCPRFNPAPWQDKVFEWKDKKFIKGKVRTAFNIPMNFGAMMVELTKKVEQGGGKFVDALCLSDHVSSWRMDLYLAVDKEIIGAENTTLSGKFCSRVYEGDFSDTGKWCQDFAGYAKQKGFEIKKMFMWYTTCPKCAKKYGQNYVVIIGQLDK